MGNVQKESVVLPQTQQRKEGVFEQYNIEVLQITKGRGTYIADTTIGKLVLKEFRGGEEKAKALSEVLNLLAKKEDNIEQILANKEGNYISKDEEGKSFILKTFISGKECDTKSLFEIVSATEKMAQLHSNLLQISREHQIYEKQQLFCVKEHEFINELYRHNKELKYVKNYIQKKHRKNEFEQLFWECYKDYDFQAQEILKKYEKHMSHYQGEMVYGLCHGDCTQHNIFMNANTVSFVNFEQMRYDMPVSDLAKFMRKILEKNQWEISLGMEMLTAYDHIRTLSYVEKYQLYFRLAYPEKFWKIANHYNNTRKVWVSGRDIDKLDKMKTQEKQRKQFLEILFYLGR